VICANPSENPLYSEQWGIHAVGLDSVWVKPIVNKKRPVIAILDTGVEIDHPDLAANIWTNSKENAGTDGYDDDNNGFADDIHGWDFINNTADIHDWNSHGTHVAGIAAAVDNQKGVVGANPLAIIMPVTVMQSDGTGDVATIVKGINYAVNNGATVLNMSFGTYANSVALRNALANAYSKAVLVAAAGNDKLGIYQECMGIPMFPAAYSFVIGVQATDNSGKLTDWSNIDCDGPTYSAHADDWGDDGMNYELSAPGADIESTVIGGNYKIYNGTSMSAPLVAGGISAIQMVKNYDSQEVLWGDLIHSGSNVIDFKTAYNIVSRPAELDLVSIAYVDSLDGGNGDGQPDAGETMRLYPTIKTTWGTAKNIKMNISVAEGYLMSLMKKNIFGEAN
jgi:subtilisin family serine protease